MSDVKHISLQRLTPADYQLAVATGRQLDTECGLRLPARIRDPDDPVCPDCAARTGLPLDQVLHDPREAPA